MRRLLLSLLAAGGTVRSIEALIDAVWAGEEPPHGARRTLMSYVSRLRSALPDVSIEQVDGGYRLNCLHVRIDAIEFESSVDAGRAAWRAGDPLHAVAHFETAQRLWRGMPYAEFQGEHWIEGERVRLTELAMAADEGRFESLLALDRHTETLADLERAAAQEPEREHLQYLTMLALYRSGRQTEALRWFQRVRQHLADTGLHPSEELRDLERQILNQDGDLDETRLAPGTDLRGYRIEEQIGEGRSGSVFAATQLAVGRRVAIKVIRPDVANRIPFIRRFEYEAQIVARLEHPHVVPLYDYWREPGGAYLVMRLLAGGTAEDRLASPQPLSPASIVLFVEQIGGALEAAHAQGIIHRNVRPENVFFDEAGVAYLADFGIAAGRESGDDIADHFIDNDLFLSPEQKRGEAATVASDIFGLGRLTEALLVGVGHRDGSASLSHACQDTIRQATAPDPEDRHDDVGTFVRALRLALVDRRFDPTSVSSNGSDPAPAMGTGHRTAPLRPYKGLLPFEEADAADFHGRAELVLDVRRRLMSSRLVALVGPSGSGKSSIARAGLIPALVDDDAFIALTVPGTHPIEQLENALIRLSVEAAPGLTEQLRSPGDGIRRAIARTMPGEKTELLLIVDQFEELFTVSDPEERSLYLDGLVEALEDPRSRLRAVITVRADFYDRPLEHRRLAALLQENVVNVLPMTTTELASAIVEPARAAGVEFERPLVEQMCTDVDGRPGMLPLLQYTLTELFEGRHGDVITVADYQAVGGVAGALAGRAEHIFDTLSAEQREAARRLFSRLITLGEGVDDTRRRARRAELATIGGEVIDLFGEHRLLSFDRDPFTREPTVEVAHEALIREWSRLRTWIDADRNGLRVLRHLTQASVAWRQAGHDSDELYRGSRLDAALEWSLTHPGETAPEEQAFLEASSALRAEHEAVAAEAAAARDRQNRRLRRAVMITAIFALGAFVAGAVALAQRGEARAQADEAAATRAVAETRRMISDASQLSSTNRRIALLLAVEAFRRDPGTASLGGLKSALTQSPGFLGYVSDHRSLTDLAWTDRGHIAGTHAEGVVLIDPAGAPEQEISLPGARLVAAHPNVGLLAVATSESSVAIVDLDAHHILHRLDHGGAVTALAFSDDGSLLATGDREGALRVYDEAFALVDGYPVAAHPETADDLRNLARGAGLPAEVLAPLAHEPAYLRIGIGHLAINRDASLIATIGGGVLRGWDTTSGRRRFEAVTTRERPGGRVLAAADGVGFLMTDDGEEAVASAAISSVELWSLEGVRREGFAIPGRATSDIAGFGLADVVFRDDQVSSLSTAGEITFASPNSTRSLTVDVQLGTVSASSQERGGSRIAVAGDGGVLLVSAEGHGLISRSFPATANEEWSVTNDGSLVVGTSVDQLPVEFWRWNESTFELDAGAHGYDSAYVNGDAIFAFDVDVRHSFFYELDVVTLRPVAEAVRFNASIATSVSPDGRLVASGSFGPIEPVRVTVFDRVAQRYIELPELPGELVRSISFAPLSDRLFVASSSGFATIYETAPLTEDPPRIVELSPPLSAGDGGVVQGSFSPDGTHLVTVSSDGAMRVRDATTLQPVGEPMIGNTNTDRGFSVGPRFSDDGRWLVTTLDGTLRLWDLAGRELVGDPFPGSEGIIHSAPNARHGVSVVGGRVTVWDLDVDRWPEIACRAVGRNMTPEEWAQFGPADEPYAPTCSRWPSLAAEPSSRPSPSGKEDHD